MQTKEKLPNMYLQTSSIACGVACMMMALNHFLGRSLSKSHEDELVQKLKLKEYDFIPAISLATYMAQQGLDIKIHHQDSHKFWDRTRLFGEDMLAQQKEAYNEAETHNINFDFSTISTHDIINELNDGRLLIYGISLFRDVKHALLVYEYTRSDHLFCVIDPLSGRKTYTEKELIQAGDLDTGRWYISIGKKPVS